MRFVLTAIAEKNEKGIRGETADHACGIARAWRINGRVDWRILVSERGGFKGFQVIHGGASCGALRWILVAGSGIHDACFLLRVEGTQLEMSSFGRDADLRSPFLPILVFVDSLEP